MKDAEITGKREGVMVNTNLLLQMQGISKSFPGVQALDRVNFSLRRGEVHGLIGENGAGKSTLMKILAGVYSLDAGDIILNEEHVTVDSPLKAQQLGISIVHQEPLLFQNLTVAENIFVGREPTHMVDLVDRSALYQSAWGYLQNFDTLIPPQTIVQDLSVAEQQVIEICKALSLKSDILILDEPTSALTDHETAQLFTTVNQLRDDGIAIVYISHRLNEIVKLADRVTVLRDGQLAGELEKADITHDNMINLMVGRELVNLYGKALEQTPTGEIVLATNNLTGQGYASVNLTIHAGEIVGLTGLVGSGRSEIGLTIFGHLSIQSGTMTLDGKPFRPRSTSDAITKGIAFVPEDRHSMGLFLTMPVKSNLSVTRLDALTKRWLISGAEESKLAAQLVESLGIRTPTLEQSVMNLSGGNQQKTMLGKWLAGSPRLLIVDEPTRGVDVGAKAEVYEILRNLAAQGIGILMISSEMTEIIGMSDRTYVMHEGKLMGELIGEGIIEQNIMTLASGHELQSKQLAGVKHSMQGNSTVREERHHAK
jgi:ribose transport system ATP-binding protein